MFFVSFYMKFIQGTDRTQLALFPACLDDSLDFDNETRLIDLFVNSLDLKTLGFEMDFIDNGRPAYHPGDLLRLSSVGTSTRSTMNPCMKSWTSVIRSSSSLPIRTVGR